jgi:hypothetical protein
MLEYTVDDIFQVLNIINKYAVFKPPVFVVHLVIQPLQSAVVTIFLSDYACKCDIIFSPLLKNSEKKILALVRGVLTSRGLHSTSEQ